MTSSAHSSALFSSPAIRWGGVALLVVVFWIVFPPFRIVSLDESGKAPAKGDESEVFDPAGFVDRFWEDRLEPNLGEAMKVEELLAALVVDPLEARKRYGLYDSRYYFAQGSGDVVEIKGRKAMLEVEGRIISLLIASPVFGNTVRDGTGLLSVNDFSGLEAFNAVSAVLNTKVETEVMPSLQESVKVGATVSFVGCAKAPETLGEGALLEFVPLQVEVSR
ncbi:DUF2291 family protein [Pelagicoccus sp. SDUM812002]|uniref:DUF2291 family protein n=1 Tax=Pelagicoccus sp. SDUM812002 TaxID=3041266 RepID=UPI00280C484A|nr:DUF2291 family protein [Pelagicoccus sp. SDUM812002]MDQ8187658.1 DUF2291 family protein [Pelagicoccus sp. SDUM812002]